MSLLIPDTGLLFWMVIIFALVFFLLAKFGFPVISGMIDKRNSHILESLESARKAQEQLEGIAAEQKALLEQARLEQARILKAAGADRDKILAQAQDQARDEAAKIVAEARAQIEVEKNNAMRDIRSQVSALSVEVAEKIIRKTLSDEKEQLVLVDKLVEEVVGNKIS